MFTVYSKPDCPYCIKAKAALSRRGIAFRTITIVAEPKELVEGTILRETFLELFPNASKVPQILDSDGNLIGGYDQLVNHLA